MSGKRRAARGEKEINLRSPPAVHRLPFSFWLRWKPFFSS